MELEAQKFIVILEQEENGVYSVHCPALQCSSMGDDRDDALEMIVDAIQGLLEFMADENCRKVYPEMMTQTLEETPTLLSEELLEILEGRAEYGQPLLVEFAEVMVPATAPV